MVKKLKWRKRDKTGSENTLVRSLVCESWENKFTLYSHPLLGPDAGRPFHARCRKGVPDIRRVVRLALTELPCRDPFALAWHRTPRYHATLAARSYRPWNRINPGMQRLFVSVRGSDEVLAATYIARNLVTTMVYPAAFLKEESTLFLRPTDRQFGPPGGQSIVTASLSKSS